MQNLYSVFDNYIFICAITGWFSAQILKAVIKFIVTGKFDKERLTGAGGMPSSHTAMVCALTVSTARMEGTNSSMFAISFILACIVMYDAMGVRRAAGEQAKIINMLVNKHERIITNEDEEELSELKEKLGHTPLEVLAGALLGILIPMFVGLFY